MPFDAHGRYWPLSQTPSPKAPLGFKVWFAFCAVLGLGVLGVVVWLAVAAIGYLNRH